MSRILVAHVADIAPDSAIQVIVEGQQIGLFNAGGTIYALDNVCTHQYAELHEGYIDASECSIECPLHGARFNLQTGRVLCVPATEPAKTYQVEVEGDEVYIRLEAEG